MEDVKVSIIVPNFNHSKFLKQRLDCIFNQTYRNFEVILLDDCSTDDSVKVLSEYSSHPKLSHFIISDKNSGSPFYQWKKGIELAQGEYIWIAESDDYADLSFLNEMVTLLDLNTNAGLAYCQSYVVNESSEILYENFINTDDLDLKRWNTVYYNKGLNEIDDYLSKKNTIPNASAVLIRRKIINLFDIQINFKMMGDWYLWVSILKYRDLIYTPKLLNYFRATTYSTRVLDSTSKLLNSCEEKIIILKKIDKVLQKRNSFVKEEIEKIVKDYVRLVSIKSLFKSKFYYNYLLTNQFFKINFLIYQKINFKKLFLRITRFK